MIVNVNKCSSVFDENFSVMKFTAIAVEVKFVCYFLRNFCYFNRRISYNYFQ